MHMIKRREFIASLAAAASSAWSGAARAQPTTMPVVGYLQVGSQGTTQHLAAAFREGLGETGYVEGRNLAIEYRSAENQSDRLPELAADLVRRHVSVIAAVGGSAPALAAKAVTTTVPIVFATAGDPVSSGLVASLNRPGGNVTGLTSMNGEAGPKRLGLLKELVPGTTRVAVLVNPKSPSADVFIAEARAAASTIGLEIDILLASTNREIDTAFATLVKNRANVLFGTPDALFTDRRAQIVGLAFRHSLPSAFMLRDFVEAGGLMSYGSSLVDQYRQVGIYVSRILKGEKPADLPVMQPTKFEFIINLQTARTLGIDVPPTLLAIADAVIE
jgi:putative tryptophan/tyrosine transport system substrate-binding protein